MRSNFLILLFCFFYCLQAYSQDAQYSQYYNAPLFLNPAFTGAADNTRAVFNYRNQWPGLNRPYRTYSFSIDHLIETASTGIGLIARKDEQGASNLSATELGLSVSYIVPISYNLYFIPALQGSWINRNLNYKDLIFGDQIDVNNPSALEPSLDILANSNRVNYLDFSAGGLLFTDVFWFGLSLNHLNTPDQSFVNSGLDKIPLKATFNLGYKFYLSAPGKNNPERSISPTLLYKTQAKFDQLDIGVYGMYEPLMLGLWYRGLPIKGSPDKRLNQDAIVMLAGVYYKGMTVSYSYDYTISSLRKYTGGAHEISLIMEWKMPYKSMKKRKPVPCPKFYNAR
jgi:type IX secretion system PorP/SprF family membrane protein